MANYSYHIGAHISYKTHNSHQKCRKCRYGETFMAEFSADLFKFFF